MTISDGEVVPLNEEPKWTNAEKPISRTTKTTPDALRFSFAVKIKYHQSEKEK